jgi:hypothetical protein
MYLDRWRYALPLRLRRLFHPDAAQQELDDELRFHAERLAESYVAQGMLPQDAASAKKLSRIVPILLDRERQRPSRHASASIVVQNLDSKVQELLADAFSRGAEREEMTPPAAVAAARATAGDNGFDIGRLVPTPQSGGGS